MARVLGQILDAAGTTSAPTGGGRVLGSIATPVLPMPESITGKFDRSVVAPVVEFSKGVGKGVLETGRQIAKATDIVNAPPRAFAERVFGRKLPTATETYEAGLPKEGLERTTPLEKAGYGTEKLLEFLAPSKYITGAQQAIGAGVEGAARVKQATDVISKAKAGAEITKGALRSAKATRAVSDLAKIGLKAIPEAVGAGAVTALQGGNAEEVRRNAEWAGVISGGIGLGFLGANKAGVALQNAGRRLYQSYMKPSLAQGAPLAADVVETGLKEAIVLTEGGVRKTADTIDELELSLGKFIDAAAEKGKTVPTAGLRTYVDSAKEVLGNTVDVAGSEKAVQQIDDMFNNFIAKYGDNIPVEEAQRLKVNTYVVLKDAYNELANATKEGMKQLVRGLKEGIVAQVPEAGEVNARLKKLYEFDKALEKTRGRTANLNLLGLGTKILGASPDANMKLLALAGQVLGGGYAKTKSAIKLYELGGLLKKLAPEAVDEFVTSPTGRQIYARLTGQAFEELSAEQKVVAKSITDFIDNPKLGMSIEDVSKNINIDRRGTPITVNGRHLADPVEGGIYYHGTVKENKPSLLSEGFNPKLNKKGFSEQPEAFYIGDYTEASMYGDDMVGVKVKPGERVKTLSMSSSEWRDTVGRSTSKSETAKALQELRKRGYDAVNMGKEIEILNPNKFEIFDVKKDKSLFEHVTGEKPGMIADSTGSQYKAGSKKVADAFSSSTKQRPVVTADGILFEIGDFGENALQRKVGSKDRFPSDEISKAIQDSRAVVRGSNDPTEYRYDNFVLLSPDQDGLKAVYVRSNARGAMEVINAHKIPRGNVDKYLDDIGAPSRIRTGILSLERSGSIPLTYGGNPSLAQMLEEAKAK